MKRNFSEQEIRHWYKGWSDEVLTVDTDNFYIDMRKEFGIPLTLKFSLNQCFDEMGAPVTSSMVSSIASEAEESLVGSIIGSSFSACKLVGLAEIGTNGEAIFTVSDSEANSADLLVIATCSMDAEDDGKIGEVLLKGGKSLWNVSGSSQTNSGRKREISARIYTYAPEEKGDADTEFMELRTACVSDMVSMAYDGDKAQKLYMLNRAGMVKDFDAVVKTARKFDKTVSGEMDSDGFWQLNGGGSEAFLCGLASKEYFSELRGTLNCVVFVKCLEEAFCNIAGDAEF